MALHPDFPTDPYAILDPAIRWFPADETLQEQGYQKLLPPLVAELRIRVQEWRDSGSERPLSSPPCDFSPRTFMNLT